MKGQEIHDWIMARLDEGRTVYATTYLVQIRITAKHRDCLRVSGDHCEVQRGKHWDSINGCRITAR